MITLNNIFNRMEAFATRNQMVRTFSKGAPENVDLDGDDMYPMLHVQYLGASYNSKVKTSAFEVYYLTSVSKEEQYEDYYVEVVNDATMLLEDMLADVRNGMVVFTNDDYWNIASASINPLTMQDSNMAVGAVLSLQLETTHDYQACNTPII